LITGRKIRMQAPSDEAERQHFVSGLLDTPRTEHARGVAVEQQRQENLRRIGDSAAIRIARIDQAQIELRHQVYDKTGQMTGWQGLAQAHGLLERSFVVDGCEFSAHDR
jgi:hypothetical protein